MNKKLSKPVITLAALGMIGAGFGVGALASANTTGITSGIASATSSIQQHMKGGMNFMNRAPGVRGSVTAINGSTLTVNSTNPKDSTVTTYTVDASNAKVMKSSAVVAGSLPQAPVAATIAAISVGDNVNIRGTVSGTNVTATDIMDGFMMEGRGEHGGMHGTSGTITAVNGSSVTITGKDGTTYTVDASTAQLEKISKISVGDLKVGDTINAEGAVSGTSVTAKHIVDGVMVGPRATQASTVQAN